MDFTASKSISNGASFSVGLEELLMMFALLTTTNSWRVRHAT